MREREKSFELKSEKTTKLHTINLVIIFRALYIFNFNLYKKKRKIVCERKKNELERVKESNLKIKLSLMPDI